MRTSTLGKALAVAALLLAPWLAQAAGLGGLQVQSSLGQPLAAEIDLVAVRPGEVDSLNVRLATPDAYQQANLQYNAGLTGIRLSLEKRASGQYFIKVAGSRSINEPFIDLLIELTWSGGKLVREYTALLDPPGYNQPAQKAGASASAAAAAPTPPEARPIAAPAAPAVSPPVAPTAARGARAQEYGPVARGDTLGRIAGELKPAGVSLEQMLVGLYRSNPDAFIRKNMNLVKSGRILRVPDAQELAAIPQAEAVQEFRTQVADWRAYSGRLADAAKTAQDSGSPARGRITASVDEGSAAGGKDVVRLSKGEPGKGEKPLTGAARARALQEELVARNKELAEASDRITQLEKTIKDMQKLAELKNPALAAAQQKAESAKVETVKPADAPKMEATKAEGAAPQAAAKTETNAPVAPAAETATAAAPPAEVKPAPAPKPKPKPVAPPPPPPEPEIMDLVMDNLPAVGGGVAALLLGGLGIAAMRRRRAQAQEEDAESMRMAPSLDTAASAVTTAAAVSTATAAPTVDDVDPVAEAEVYIAYGRDEQAEEILKEAMGRDPAREDVQVKLAEVYAARKDVTAFTGIAQSLHGLTGGAGDNWTRVAALGYALDAGNSLYAGGKDAALPAGTGSASSTDIDFELGGDNAGNPDIALDAYPAGQATEWEGMRGMAVAAEAGVAPAGTGQPDFNLDVPPAAGTQTDIVLEAPTPEQSNVIDFHIDLPSLDQPMATNLNLQLPPVDDPTISSFSTPAPVAGADTVLDFKLDVGDLNIKLEEPTEVTTVAQPLPGGKDGHWYDVQQKFDLAKAYQEMGDNEGAREILQEVIQEGDAEQKSQAQQLLGALG